MSETLKTKKAEESFGAAVAVVLLILLPLLGATAMVICSIISMIAYIVLFRERLRERGWLVPALCFTLAAVVAVAVIVAVSMNRAH